MFSQGCLAASSLARFLVGLDIYFTLSPYARYVHYRLDTIFLGLLSLITARSFFFFSRTSIYPTSTLFFFIWRSFVCILFLAWIRICGFGFMIILFAFWSHLLSSDFGFFMYMLSSSFRFLLFHILDHYLSSSIYLPVLILFEFVRYI